MSALFARIGARVPVVQAPMAGSGGVALAIAAIRGGALGSLPCAMLTPAQVVAQAGEVRAGVDGPINLNFFCHTMPDTVDERAWRAALAPFHADEGVAPDGPPPALRQPFGEAMAAAVETVRPEVVSFHFGLPSAALVARVKATGALILGSATHIDEAVWLAGRGCDAVIAQGYEAGGHAGYFLGDHRPVGLVALVPAIVDAIDLPVIAAGGIADARAVAAAIALGAAGVQVGTAYLSTAQAMTSAVHRKALAAGGETVFTNLMTGRRARGLRNRLIDTLGPVSDAAPPFPHAATALAPLRAHAEAQGRGDYSPLWAGQSVGLARATDARVLTETLGAAALAASEIA